MNSMIISFSGWICSILRTRHRNFVGCWLPPNVPPKCVSIMALSTSVSAVSPKQCSFQYLSEGISRYTNKVHNVHINSNKLHYSILGRQPEAVLLPVPFRRNFQDTNYAHKNRNKRHYSILGCQPKPALLAVAIRYNRIVQECPKQATRASNDKNKKYIYSNPFRSAVTTVLTTVLTTVVTTVLLWGQINSTFQAFRLIKTQLRFDKGQGVGAL